MRRLATTMAAVGAPFIGLAAPAGAEPTEQSATHPAPVYMIGACFDMSEPIEERPERIVYNCDGSAAMEEMTWSSWGPDGAVGTGTDNAVECKPNCAEGTHLLNPIVVHAWNPRPAEDERCPAGVQFYSDLSIAYPHGVPPWIVPGITWAEGVDFVTIDGMPGVHWSDQKPFSCLPLPE